MNATYKEKDKCIFIGELIKKMTITEKIGQLNQLGTSIYKGKEQLFEDFIREGKVGSFLTVRGAEKTNYMQQIAVNESRLGIPLLFAEDVIHGYETLFPIPLAESCTWDPELTKNSAVIAAKEAAAAGIHWTYSPMMDISRDPRWGRVAEGYGEDPLLTSRFVKEKIKGYQGNLKKGEYIPGDSVLACGKHFVGYGAVESGKEYNSVDLSISKLFNVHLPPFREAINAGVASIMSAFNDLNGTPSTVNQFLLKDILRQNLSFKGLLVSDWNAIAECITHGYSPDRKAAALQAFNAGIDVDMASRVFHDELIHLFSEDKISEEALDNAVYRVLSLKYDLELFEKPFRTSREKEQEVLFTSENKSKSLEIAKDSVVLLKNGHETLPLVAGETILLTGPLADDKNLMVGSWACNGKAANVITLYRGLKKSNKVNTVHIKGCKIDGEIIKKDQELIEKEISKVNKIVVVMGEPASESGEAKSKSNIGLVKGQEEYFNYLRKFGKPIIVVLMNGRPLEISHIAEYASSIIEAWHLGTMVGTAIASILTGEYNPNGKLTMTFPRSVGQIPIYYSYTSTGRPKSKENVHTSRYLDEKNSGLFPFGYGLSYTSFEYKNIEIEKNVLTSEDDCLKVSCMIKNTGNFEGKEIIQLYVNDHFASQVRPVKELIDFKKIELKPNEQRTVSFIISAKALGFYDNQGNYILESGEYTVFVGTNSQETISEKFELVLKETQL